MTGRLCTEAVCALVTGASDGRAAPEDGARADESGWLLGSPFPPSGRRGSSAPRLSHERVTQWTLPVTARNAAPLTAPSRARGPAAPATDVTDCIGTDWQTGHVQM